MQIEEFRIQVISFDFFFSQGKPGVDGLPGHPGEEGGHVSIESYLFFFFDLKEYGKMGQILEILNCT